MGVDVSQASRAFMAALRAGGIQFVTAFPGSPTTTLALLLEAEGAGLGIEFRWAINENVALSQAFGAAMAGRGAAAIMKHVGINVAADALQVMGVVHGLPAPLLLIEGADAKPGSSQSAQDNRPVYAGSPQLVVLSPTSPAEIVEAVGDACAISRAAGMLVVVRGDHRCFASAGSFESPAPLDFDSSFESWPTRKRAMATSARTYADHLGTRARVLDRLAPWIDTQVRAWAGSGPIGVVIAGHLGHEAGEVVRARGLPGLRLGLEHPLPERAIVDFARALERVIVLEECTPWLESAVRALLHRAGVRTAIVGRSDLGDRRPVGRISAELVESWLEPLGPPGVEERHDRIDPRTSFAGFADELAAVEARLDAEHPLSNFAPSDPRGPLFDHLRTLAAAVFVATDPGITGVLALGSGRADVKMHMGGAVPIAAGWSRGGQGLAIAVVGDTNLPHSEWLGILDAVDHGDDLLVVVADNGSSEMTQRIVTPRVPPRAALASFAAVGVRCAQTRVAADTDWRDVLDRAAGETGVRLVWAALDRF